MPAAIRQKRSVSGAYHLFSDKQRSDAMRIAFPLSFLSPQTVIPMEWNRTMIVTNILVNLNDNNAL
jgi:hypothetical protein